MSPSKILIGQFLIVLTIIVATMWVRPSGWRTVHPVVAQAARELLNKSENERSGVLSTALRFLSLYRDPVVAAVTSASDWQISDLVEGPRPVSLYLVVPPLTCRGQSRWSG